MISSPSDSELSSPIAVLPYKPEEHPRETARHYISASEKEIKHMMAKVGIEKLGDLFAHLPKDNLFTDLFFAR